MTLRRPFCLGLLLSALLSLPALAQTSAIPWMSNLDAAKAEARRTGRLVLVHFWTEDCAPCLALERNVFNQPEVAGVMTAQFVPVKLNANENPATAAGMGVTRVPTDIVITPEGEVISKAISPATPMAYVAELSHVTAKFAGRSGQAFAAAAATAPAPSQLNAAYAGMQMGPATTPSLPAANQAAAADRYAASVPIPNQPAQTYLTQQTMPGVGPAFGGLQGGPIAPPGFPPQSGMPVQGGGMPQQAGGPAPQMAAQPQGPITNNFAAMGAPQVNQFAQPGVPAAPQMQPGMVTNQFAQPAPQMSQMAAAQQITPAQMGPAAVDPNANRYAQAPAVPQTYLTTNPAAQQAAAPPVAAGVPDARQLPPGAMPLGFDGYCPVSMRNSNLTKWIAGNPKYGVQHRGRTYWFAGPQEQAQFWASPDVYAPALSGLDPVMFIDHHQQVPGSREHSVDYDNTFYMFASEASLQQFQTNPKKYVSGVREAMGIKQARTLR